MGPRRRGSTGHLERHELLAHATGLLLRKYGTAVEFALVQRHEKSHPRLDRRGVFIQFVTVKRVTHFRAQRVARAEAGWLDAERLTFREHGFPDLNDGRVSTDDFKTVFTGVTRARNQHTCVAESETADLIFLQIRRAV